MEDFRLPFSGAISPEEREMIERAIRNKSKPDSYWEDWRRKSWEEMTDEERE